MFEETLRKHKTELKTLKLHGSLEHIAINIDLLKSPNKRFKKTILNAINNKNLKYLKSRTTKQNI